MALSPRLSFPDNWPSTSIHRMATSLISDQVGTHPSITLEWPCTHIRSCENTSHSHIRMALSPRPSIPGTSPGSSIPIMAISLISDHVGTNPTVISEWLSTHIWHGRNQSSHHDRMAQPLHLTCSSEWLWISILISVMEGTNPLTMTDGSALTSDHGRNQSYHHVRMAYKLITSPWREPRSGEHQDSPWGTQTSC